MAQLVVGLLGPVASLVFGILILMFPKILNYLIGIYLIVVGAIGVLDHLI
ncbi:DUF3096 domain-containing protein [Candidatus Woesearchaeota archaeon]|nr:DUF3096 domain-containing protein [Candidatus Woesearchaeota archaeon]